MRNNVVQYGRAIASTDAVIPVRQHLVSPEVSNHINKELELRALLNFSGSSRLGNALNRPARPLAAARTACAVQGLSR